MANRAKVATTKRFSDASTPRRPESSRAKVIGPFDGNNNNDGERERGRGGNGGRVAAERGGAKAQDVSKYLKKGAKSEYNKSIKLSSPHGTPVPTRSKGDPSAAVARHRNSLPKDSNKPPGGCDMETTLPKIDWDAMETHLLAAKDEEKRRRNDREEIRRRLAMGVESDDTSDSDKIAKKPSLHSRLQSGMNLQICFMNETASDGSDSENHKDVAPPESKSDPYISLPVVGDQKTQALNPELDFFTKQAKLQTEARTALTQAKELARVQMQVERQQRKRNRISDLVRQSLERLGIPFPWECRRLSRQILTEMNIAQLQVIVNDLHTQIEGEIISTIQLCLLTRVIQSRQD